ncbi:MAG: biotin--[acetyl-CoA-carboxylase] ligase, partial [Vicinamibacteria bacterium]|nr:biotin--[acetyl-CoA-carboxylase] ligase [Vicinamibacteria bacterium]
MSPRSDPFIVRLEGLLREQGLVWPGVITHLQEVDSTNEWLKQRAREDAREWQLVVAERQSAGRGRRGRAWQSPPGNLYVSILVDIDRESPVSRLIALLASVAIAEGLARCGVGAQLKWPNDVWIGHKKVAGILAEAIFVESRARVVVGFGINILAHPDPQQISQAATSLAEEIGPSVDACFVLAHVLACFKRQFDRALADGGQAALADWRRWSVPWWHESVVVESEGTTVQGVALDIDAQGALILLMPDG